MALLSPPDYHADGDSGSDSTGTGTSGNPYATAQKCHDVVDTEVSSNLVTASSNEVNIKLVAGNCGSNTVFSGITDDSTNYIRLSGLVSTTAKKWDTGKPYLETAGSNQRGLNNSLNNTQVDSIQIFMGAFGTTDGILNSGTAAIFNAIVIKGSDSLASSNVYGVRNNNSSGTVYYRNVFTFNLEGGSGTFNRGFNQLGAGTGEYQNCEDFSDTTIAGTTYSFIRNAGTMNCTNCYASAKNTYVSVTSITTSASRTTSGDPAALDTILMTTTNFSDPLNVVTNDRDFSLVASTVLDDGSESTDLSADFTTDFHGNTISTWPIGAAERISAGGADPVPPLRRRMMMRMAA